MLEKLKIFLIVSIIMGVVSGCSLQLVAKYDEKTVTKIEEISAKVDHFFLTMTHKSPQERKFKNYEKVYVDIEVLLNSLKLRQQSRSNNRLTIKQVDIAIDQWSLDVNRHKEKNRISNFSLNSAREFYRRLFVAMVKGEEFKPRAN